MADAFSFNREFDFVRLDGLRRATGRNPHEWDLYILKELIDNALDADEVLWQQDASRSPRIIVEMEYFEAVGTTQVHIKVRNRATFPVDQIEAIFNTHWYTSRKAVAKGLSRGALGNALKTLLGIPCALFAKTGDSLQPFSDPIAIECGNLRYLPRYEIDVTAQTIQVCCERKPIVRIDGTSISVNLDHFWQERPRTLAEIECLAEQYELCNPHADFRWSVDLNGKGWTSASMVRVGWTNKFLGLPHVEWYSPTTFQDLLGALYRNSCQNRDSQEGLPLDVVNSRFAGFAEISTAAALARDFGSDRLSAHDIDGQAPKQLYLLLAQHSPRFDSSMLGSIGPDHITNSIATILPVDSGVFYERATDPGDDPSVPFVIEVAAAWLKEGRRHIWTAINFAPTYRDPFANRHLHTKAKPDGTVLGLTGILDCYDFKEDIPSVLFVHVICPNVQYDEFSKTEIDHLPFRDVLGAKVDAVLNCLKQTREAEELELEEKVKQSLSEILSELGESEKFIFSQLIERVRTRLSKNSRLAIWLETPGALERLHAFVADYESRSPVFSHRVARRIVGTIFVPHHPDRHIAVLAEHVSPELLAQYHVNKILFVHQRELEPVIVENGWLTRMDLALLQNLPDLGELRNAVVLCAINSTVPILFLHDGDESGTAFLGELRSWLDDRHVGSHRVVDLGPPTVTRVGGAARLRIIELMPEELAKYFISRFTDFGIPMKSHPPAADIRKNASAYLERLLKGYLWEGLSDHFEVTRLIENLDNELHFTDAMNQLALDAQLINRLEDGFCRESYATVLTRIVDEFFTNFMGERSQSITDFVTIHLTRMREKVSR